MMAQKKLMMLMKKLKNKIKLQDLLRKANSVPFKDLIVKELIMGVLK